MNRFTKMLMVAIALFMSIVSINAQATGNLSGTITDPKGAVVPGATVTARDADRGIERTVSTNDSGLFTFAQLPPGNYTVTVEGTGFKRVVAPDVKVSVSTDSTLNLVLEVGAVGETVTVTSAQDVVNTTSPTITNVIDTRQVQDLPLAGRNPLELAALQAGIAVSGSSTRTASISGLRGSATNITQDGINAMDNYVKTDSLFALSAPSLTSTQEFSITTNTVGPDGGRGVAQVNVVTRGGTNEYHGGGFYQRIHDAQNANTWFNNYVGTPKQLLRQKYYGFDIGGPVHFLNFGEGVPKHWNGKNIAAFYFNYEAFRENFSTTRNRVVLTPEARAGTFRYVGTDSVLHTVDLLSIGNVHTLNSVTAPILAAIPSPNNSNGCSSLVDTYNIACYQYNVTGSDPSDKYVFRYDHQLFTNTRLGSHKLELVYNRTKLSLFPDTFNAIEAAFPGGVNAGQGSTRQLLTPALVSTFGSNITNTFRYGRQWSPVGFLRESSPTTTFIAFSGITTPDNTFMSQGRNTIVNQITDSLAWAKGSHLWKFGGDFQNIYALSFNDAGINETINLSPNTSGLNTANGTGILLSSLPFGTNSDLSRAGTVYANIVGLLGSASQTYNVKSATSGFVPGFTRERPLQEKDLALYAQDQWRMRSNFTVSAGVRWDYMGVPTVPNGLAIQLTNFNDIWGVSGAGNLFHPTAAAGSQTNAVGTLNFVSGQTGKGLYGNDWNNFAPFIGFAYSPSFRSGIGHILFGDEGKSSLRAGYSISYLHDGFTVISNALGTGTTNPGLIQSSANNTPSGVLTSAGITLAVPVFAMPVTDRQNFLLNANNGLWAIDPKLRTPYVQQWNFGFEREIAKNTAIEIRYVGNHAIKVWRAYDINEVNIFENGFLQEFKNAQTNLAARGNSGFAPGCVGCVALPIFDKLFAGLAGSSGYTNSSFITNLQRNEVGVIASSLAFSSTYRANRENPANGLAANFFVANPNAAFARVLTNDAMSNYHALELEIRRRFSGGLQFQADYTFSKSLGNANDAAGSQSDLTSWRTLRDKSLDYRRSNQDQTHRFVANAIYELPFGKGKPFLSSNGLADRIVGGWSLGGIVVWSVGPPWFISSNRATYNSFNAANNGAQLTGITFEEFKKNVGIYKTAAGIFFINPTLLDITTSASGRVATSKLKSGYMTAPAPGTFGNFPLNSINGPQYFDLDLSLTKRIPIGERVRLELKATAIDVLNHPNFAYSGQTFDATNFGQITSTRGNANRQMNFIGTVRF